MLFTFGFLFIQLGVLGGVAAFVEPLERLINKHGDTIFIIVSFISIIECLYFINIGYIDI